MGAFHIHHVTSAVDIDNPVFTKNGTSNTYLDAQRGFLLEMYPPFRSGFQARIIALIVILALIMLVSTVYLLVTNAEARRRGREPWLYRVIQRPAGRYFVLNQYKAYPLCAIVLSALWIAYTVAVYRMFGGVYAKPYSLFFWIPCSYIPFFCLLSTTTFAVLSGANLASQGSKPNTHKLGPWLANSVYFVFIPLVTVAISATGIWTGFKWQTFGYAWETAYLALGEAGRSFNGTVDWTLNKAIQQMMTTRGDTYFAFQDSQYVCTIVYCLSAMALIFLNVSGGFYLLWTLRAIGQGPNRNVPVPRNTPLVAPLQPFRTESPRRPSETSPHAVDSINEKDIGVSLASSPNMSAIPRPSVQFSSMQSQGTGVTAAQTKLKRLRWDVWLFFVAVVPVCLLFIGFSLFATHNYLYVLQQPALLEFMCIGLVYVYSVITLVSLVVLTIKGLLSLYGTPKTEYEGQGSFDHNQGPSRRPIRANFHERLESTESSEGFGKLTEAEQFKIGIEKQHQRQLEELEKNKLSKLLPRWMSSRSGQRSGEVARKQQMTETGTSTLGYVPQLAWNWSNQSSSVVQPSRQDTSFGISCSPVSEASESHSSSPRTQSTARAVDIVPQLSSCPSPKWTAGENDVERGVTGGGAGCVRGVIITSVREVRSESV
ncbi:hypothetical protein ACM66B_003984 [Microbotryomycetes sp. NB124-2]